MTGQTWKSITAGILAIVSGAFGLIRIAGLIGLRTLHTMPFRFNMPNRLPGGTSPWPNYGMPGRLPFLNGYIGLAIAIILAILAVLAVVGGVYILRRKVWGLALASSIAATFLSWPMGIAAIILTILSKKEFD